MLTREAILEAGSRLEIEKIKGGVPGIGEMWVAEQLDEVIDWVLESGISDGETKARMICASACDETGKLIFTREDVPAVMLFGSSKKMAIVKPAFQVNGLNRKKEDAEKN